MMQIREEVNFTKGRIIVRGKLVTRGKAKRADYILCYKPNIPIAIVEAKDNNHSVGDGMQQDLDYAVTLNIPFVFSSNGDGFVFHDRTGTSMEKEATLSLDAFPSPKDLWDKYRVCKGLTPNEEAIVLQDYFEDGSGKGPRYYQQNAINAAIEATAQGPEPYPPRHGHRHRQDLHRLSDYLAIVEGRSQETDPVSCRPQRPG
jgi:type I restriction enzyme R subunit